METHSYMIENSYMFGNQILLLIQNTCMEFAEKSEGVWKYQSQIEKRYGRLLVVSAISKNFLKLRDRHYNTNRLL